MSVQKYFLTKTRNLLYTDIFQLKKRLIITIFVLRYFLMGVEYSIILPTAILYMRSFGAGTFFTGLTIAAYPTAAIISLPVFGYFYDRTKRLKELLLVLNLFQAIGNLVYALPYSIWLPLAGRFLAGIGDGFQALTVGELTYLYDDSQRLGILSLLELGRVLGLIVGPSFNFLIEGHRFQLSTWVLDNNTLPGVLMAILWVILEILTFVCVFNLAKELIDLNKPPVGEEKESLLEHQEEQDAGLFLPSSTAVPITTNEAELAESDLSEDEKKSIRENHEALHSMNNDNNDLQKSALHSSDESLFSPTLEKESFEKRDIKKKKKKKRKRSFESTSSTSSTSTSSKSAAGEEDDEEVKSVGKGIFHEKQVQFNEYWNSLKEIFCVEFLIITSTDLILWFCQTNFEILAPYITELDYKWSPQLTGMVYVIGGVVIIFVFLAMYLIASKTAVKDSHLLMVSLVVTQFSLALLVFESTMKDLHKREAMFAIIAILVFISIPLNLVCSKTMLSKLFHPEKMGVVQGLSSGIARLTMISGPLLSGYIFKDRVAYGAVTSVFVFMNIIGFFMGMSRIHKRQRKLKKELRITKTLHHHHHDDDHHHHKKHSSASKVSSKTKHFE